MIPDVKMVFGPKDYKKEQQGPVAIAELREIGFDAVFIISEIIHLIEEEVEPSGDSIKQEMSLTIIKNCIKVKFLG